MICLPDPAVFDISTSSILGYDSLLNFQVNGLPPNAEASFSQNPLTPSETAQLTIDLDAVTEEGIYTLEILAITPGADTSYRYVDIELVYSNFEDVALIGPADGNNGVEELPTFTWVGSPYANSYEIEIATSPAFGTTIFETASGITLTSYTPSQLLKKNTAYFWRVRPVNICGPGDYTRIYALHTETLSCAAYSSEDGPLFISAQGLPSVESIIDINASGTINDFNIPKIKGRHDLIKHIDLSLISPAGTEVLLFSDLCGNTTLLDIGFDDQAPSDIPCPPIGGQVHIPQESLSAFHGENPEGDWKLRMQVVDEDSEGGALETWSIQFCTNVTLNAPFLVINDTLEVPPGEMNIITNNHLLVDDADTEADELTFTVVSLPEYGTLQRINSPLEVGSTFTQASLNLGNIRYMHDGSATEFDQFTFTVSDPEGGWFGQPQFNFKIDKDAVVGTNNLSTTLQVQLYPNPAKDQLQLVFGESLREAADLDIHSLHGQVLLQQHLPVNMDTHMIDTHSLPAGMYILRIDTANGQLSKKLLIHR